MGTLLTYLPTILSVIALCMLSVSGVNKNALTIAGVVAMALFVIFETNFTRSMAFNTAALGGLLVYVAIILFMYFKWKKNNQESSETGTDTIGGEAYLAEVSSEE